MWICLKCGEKVEDQFESCWRCRAPRAGVPTDAGTTPGQTPTTSAAVPVKWRASYRIFSGTLASWDDLFGEAADFASEIGRERLINISHSCDHHDGVVVVWYWAEDKTEDKTEELPA